MRDIVGLYLKPPDHALVLCVDEKAQSQALLEQGVELIAPHRANRRRRTREGRALRRWKIERLFAGLHNFRRLVVRWERYPENFLGFIQLGCILILLRRYL